MVNRKALLSVALGMALMIVTTLASPPKCHAISEYDYAHTYQSQVLPFYFQHGRFGTIPGVHGVALGYAAFENPIAIGSVVISPGFNESYRKYAEVAFDLFQKGYSVYIFEHRGEGTSGRILADTHKGHIDRFSYFVYDLKKFVDEIVPQDKPRFLLAHSLGGAIGALYLERFPKDFQAAVLSSPMLEMNLGRPEWLATVQLMALSALGKKNDYAPGTGYYDPAKVVFEENSVTQSRARFDNNTQILVDHPDLFLAGQTVQWVLEGIRGSRLARSHAKLNKTPTLVFQAENDQLVKDEGQNEFCANARRCRVLRFRGAKHEILQEKDTIREVALAKIDKFFARRAIKFQRQMRVLAQASL